jgi:hypothetical protein
MGGGDDITIINCQTKLLIFENLVISQKLFNSYVFSYHGNCIKGVHRNLYVSFNLTDSLVSVGFTISASISWNANFDYTN